MPKGYFDIGSGNHVAFSYPTGAYTGLDSILGVLSAPPANSREVEGNPIDYGCTRVRIKLANGKSYTRYVDPDSYSAAFGAVVGVSFKGSTISGLFPVRKRVYR